MFTCNQLKSSNVLMLCFFAVSSYLIMIADMGIGQVIPTNASFTTIETYQGAGSTFPMFGIDKLFKNFIVKDLVTCISSYSELQNDICVKNLLLQINTFRNGSATLNEFYSKVRSLNNQACTAQCDQNYRTAMMKIVNKCVPQLNQKLAANPPNGTDIVQLSQATYQIGSSLPNFIKDFICTRNPDAPETCTMNFINFANRNRLLTKPPALGNFSFFSGAGVQAMTSSLNLTAIFILGPESFCTKCNQILGQKVESYFAYQLLPSLSSALPANAINRLVQGHSRWITKLSSVCGPAYITNAVRPPRPAPIPVPLNAISNSTDVKLTSNSVQPNTTPSTSSAYAIHHVWLSLVMVASFVLTILLV